MRLASAVRGNVTIGFITIAVRMVAMKLVNLAQHRFKDYRLGTRTQPFHTHTHSPQHLRFGPTPEAANRSQSGADDLVVSATRLPPLPGRDRGLHTLDPGPPRHRSLADGADVPHHPLVPAKGSHRRRSR